MTREMGKVLNETARRRAGGHRHDLLHGRRRAAACSGRPCRPSCATSSRCRCASRLACARSSRRGISRWRSRRGRSSRRSSAATRSCSSRRRRRRCRRCNFVKVLEDAGIPKGVVNMVTGDGDEVGTPLTTHPAVRVVSFTGSTHVGRIVNQAAAPRFKKVHLEMGGKNVIMIMDDAEPRAGRRRLPLGRVRHGGAALHGREPRRRAREGLQARSSTQFVAARQVARRRRRPARRRRRWGRRSASRSCRR